MTILPGWVRTLGAAGAAANAATACTQRRAEEDAVDARLQAFHRSEQVRLAALRPSPRRRTTRAA